MSRDDTASLGGGASLPRYFCAEDIARACEGGRWLRGYIKGKLRADPVFAAGEAAVAECGGPVVDLGCGLGLFGMWLRARGHAEPYRGCDLGGWKIRAGNEAASRLGCSDFAIIEGDMLELPLEGAGCVCAFDVLHYLPQDGQERLIGRLAAAARGGAVVLIRTGVRGCGWRSWATILEELWTRATGWIGGGRINFPGLADLVAAFEKQGCRVEARPLWGKTPFSSHWLKVCARG